MSTFKKLIADNPIRRWRKKHGYSQSEAASLLGVSIMTIQKWEEHGGHAPERGEPTRYRPSRRDGGAR
jgi:transcriptional regulator with XRE-family HTH domain